MSPSILPDRIELDGVIELLRCPDFQHGWSSSNIRIGYSPDSWNLPCELVFLREEWEQRHPNERSDPKVALRDIQINRDHTLSCQLQACNWREVRPLHEGPKLDKDAFIRSRPNGCEMLLPNIGVVHVIASTSDGSILTFRRSDLSHYHPGAWSATYEEGLAPDDLGGNDVFQRAARRGLSEEVAAQLHSVPLEAFRVVSVVLERPLGNPAVIVKVELQITRAELPSTLPSNELDETSLVLIPIDLICLRDVITTPSFTFGSYQGEWHPTARYRLLVAIAHFFGEDAATDVLSRVQCIGNKTDTPL